jgi:hypothetical protein
MSPTVEMAVEAYQDVARVESPLERKQLALARASRRMAEVSTAEQAEYVRRTMAIDEHYERMRVRTGASV